MKLRPDQNQSVSDVRDACRRHRRVIYCAPTGGGKTVIACEMMRAALDKGKRVLFLAHARELVLQARDRLAAFDIEAGIIMSGIKFRPLAPIQVASKDTLISRTRREWMEYPPADLVIVDECHRSTAPTWVECIDHYAGGHVIGLSATPARPSGGKGLGDIYGEIVMGPTYATLRDLGVIVPTRVYSHPVDLSKVPVGRDDYKREPLQETMRQRRLVGDLVAHWLRHAHDRQTVAFTTGIAHSVALADEFATHGIRVEHVDGETPKEHRDQILKRLKYGDVQIVTNCQVLTEGWDCPVVSCTINAQPTKSIVRFRQMTTRSGRACAGKDDAVLLDHAGGVHEHGFPDSDMTWDLKTTNVSDEAKRQRAAAVDDVMSACPECGHVFQGKGLCPGCRAVAVVVPTPPLVQPGTLEEITRRPKRRKSTRSPERKSWDKFLYIAAHKGMTLGAASMMFKRLHGRYPPPEFGVTYENRSMQARAFIEGRSGKRQA